MLRAVPAVSDAIDVRELANWIQNYRAQKIRQRATKVPFSPWDESYQQNLGAVELEGVDSSDHAVLDTNLKMVRTKLEIPYPVETSEGLSLFTRIAPADKLEQKFKLISFTALPFVGNGRFNKQEIFASHYDKRIYIYSKDPSFYEMKYINIKGIFANPLEVFKFLDPTLTIDQMYEMEYPVNLGMAEDIIITANTQLYKFTVTGIENNESKQADQAVNQGMQDK
jgi:hypothetical protein